LCFRSAPTTVEAQTGTYNIAAAQLGSRLFGDTILSYNRRLRELPQSANVFADTVAFRWA
jgi:hypothetical protein